MIPPDSSALSIPRWSAPTALPAPAGSIASCGLRRPEMLRAHLDTATSHEGHPEGWTPNVAALFGVHPLGCCGGSQALVAVPTRSARGGKNLLSLDPHGMKSTCMPPAIRTSARVDCPW